MYGKLFETIFDGTLYGEWEAIITLEQMVILADELGIVDMTPQAISGRTSIPLEIIDKGIGVLEQVDPNSRTTGEEGRRIILIDEHKAWGWLIVNYEHYRGLASREDKKSADKERIKKKRSQEKNDKSGSNGSVASSSTSSQEVADCSDKSENVANVAHTDTDTDANTVIKKKNTKKEKKSSKKKFEPPTVDEVANYCIERNNNIDPEQFVDYYIARDWILTNKQKMKCWMASVRTWERNNFTTGVNKNVEKRKSAVDLVREANNLDEPDDTDEAIDVTADSELIPDK